MLKNFITFAFRNILKRKLYSFVNIFGLAMGMAACLVILKYVDFELSYDNFHKNAATIHRVLIDEYRDVEFRGTKVISSAALGPSLLADILEIKTFVRTHPMYGGAVVRYKGEADNSLSFFEEEMQFADSTFFDVFTYSSIQGSLNTAMNKPNAVVIAEKIAKKYFGRDKDYLGKIFHVSGGWADGDYEVTAVIPDGPQNSHFTFDFLFPIHNLLQHSQYKKENGWLWYNFITYVQFHPHADRKTVEAKMPGFIEKYHGKELKESNSKEIITFQPLRDIHFRSGLSYESSQIISVTAIYFYIVISVLILAIAWINYINLSTARATERAREVGVRKTVGAYKAQLVIQFVFESFLINLLSVLVAVVMAIGLLPVLGEILGKEFSFDFTDYRLWVILMSLFLIGSIASGFYPALVLSSFNITEVINGKSEKVNNRFSLRKTLVVFQFAASLILMAGTFAIYRQVTFMREHDKGLIMDQMLIVNSPKGLLGEGAKQRLITFKNELKKIPGVLNVATSDRIPGSGSNLSTNLRKNGTPEQDAKYSDVVWIDPDFIETYGVTVLAGRAFNPEIKSDMESILINEASLYACGLAGAENAIGEQLILGEDTVSILGVLKNYHWNSLKTEFTPWIFKADTICWQNYSLQLDGKNINETIRKVEKQYKESFPDNAFDYYFLDDFFNSHYKGEQQFIKIFGLFAVLAIIIACLGLWGLASFTTAQRLKEISIRKILGASTTSIVSLLSSQFLKLILISSIIVLPFLWYAIDTWLDNFAFRTRIGWDLFLLPVTILSIIALSTIGVQILKGARSQPTKFLRSQ